MTRGSSITSAGQRRPCIIAAVRGRLGFSKRGRRQHQRGGRHDCGKSRGHDPRYRRSPCNGVTAVMTVETIRHWHIGDVDVARIVEVNAYEDDISMLLKDETPE